MRRHLRTVEIDVDMLEIIAPTQHIHVFPLRFVWLRRVAGVPEVLMLARFEFHFERKTAIHQSGLTESPEIAAYRE